MIPVLAVGVILLAVLTSVIMGRDDTKKPEESAAETASSSIEASAESLPEEPSVAEESSAEVALRDISTLPAGTEVTPEEIKQKKTKKWFEIRKIKKGDEVYERIYGKSFPAEKGAKIKLKDLRYIHLLHYNFDGKIVVGELIVNKEMAKDIRDIFYALYKKKYQIYSMYLIDDFWKTDGNQADTDSCDADNTSAFCYRTIAHTSTLSNHAEGYAIDINPKENPYIIKSGDHWVDSDHPEIRYPSKELDITQPHVIHDEDDAYLEFAEYDFRWGGNWDDPDYQHFEYIR